ncbi:ABC transporter ATP-binding protein [Desulfurobacterium atlanticum]|uniref:Peptide/nickel transport system ATP-binding protein n=1 Tax=Desulfurobacterium atlanticum TaxID=240169 RepID=A0A238ZGX0_9BACT|nr:ABC transporter ATP-binding protein [Desulfurobacterium atlanticum]SNR82271.1 peptide/nickel transport system ATP-binding protein [Desulfurobacterium atlanticum]
MALLEVKNLSVTFKNDGIFSSEEVKAVKNVSFSLKKGEVLGIVGQSGSGKTTIGRAVLGLIPYEGKIDFKGNRISCMFQDPLASLHPYLSIRKQLLDIVPDEERIRNLFKKFNLDYEIIGKKKPSQLSGGQRQRVIIIRSLLNEPDLIIADEPISMLDVTLKMWVLKALRELKETYGLSMLFITHDLLTTKYVCDRIMVMKDGEVVEEGTLEEIFTSPKKGYTKELLEAIPKV